MPSDALFVVRLISGCTKGPVAVDFRRYDTIETSPLY